MKTISNKGTCFTVKPQPVLTKETLSDLFSEGRVEIDTENRIVFAEVESSGFYILCERLELDSEYQDITLFYDDLEITNEITITEIADWLYSYATNEISNTDSGFSHQDKQHANSLIHS